MKSRPTPSGPLSGPTYIEFIVFALVAVLGVAASVCGAGEIGFVEDFALAKDRAAALKQLIPGTETYYYYHCLHDQNLGRLPGFTSFRSDYLTFFPEGRTWPG